MKKFLFCSVVALFIAPLGSLASIIGGPVYNPDNGHQYYLLSANTWTASQSEAAGLGGNLAIINDAAEQSFVASTFLTYGGSDRSLWIGLHEVGFEGNYQWVDNSPLSYVNWAVGEPNNFNGIEAFVHMERPNNAFGNPAGFWNDAPNNGVPGFAPYFGVVEVPEPSMGALLAIAIPALGYLRERRRRP